MITNGNLIVLLNGTQTAECADGHDLSKLIHDGTLRQYFGEMNQTTSEAKLLSQTEHCGSKRDYIVVTERGLYPDGKDRDALRSKLKGLGIRQNHILFGEDYASGYHHIVLKICELCD
ncbi:MAG: hypothetical protein M0P64_04455 [Candidatus Pacebacteria bacterium]|jgi:hypothetical protein|nr:hypothetical protein [Candidatus Paceibacterota bacterium]